MIIAKNDEEKRSRIWRMVTVGSSFLIVIIAIYLLTKMFTSNPLEGTWADEDGSMYLRIKGNGSLVVTIPEIAEETSVDVEMDYTMDKEEKTISIKENEEELQKLADGSDGLYSEETLENALSPITTTFDYSVDQERLTLTEREYGEQLILIKE